jgi:hypothetical protein
MSDNVACPLLLQLSAFNSQYNVVQDRHSNSTLMMVKLERHKEYLKNLGQPNLFQYIKIKKNQFQRMMNF